MIKNSDLEELLYNKGRNYVITMYINHKINITKKQLDYILNYKVNHEKKR